jgi:general stress protein CsbA
MVQDEYRYKVTACLLVQGILLPFAVRMYRTRLTVDAMLLWRNGVDDMGAFYLVASAYAGIDLFRTFLLSPHNVLYAAITFLSQWSALLLTIVIVIEACLLGCTTRLQIVGVLTPIAVLAISAPSEGPGL